MAGRQPIDSADLIRRLVVQVSQGDGGPLVERQVHDGGPESLVGRGREHGGWRRFQACDRPQILDGGDAVRFDARFTTTRRTQAPGASSTPTFAQSRCARAKAS